MVHLPLLLMKLPLKSYDTNFHIFFASHYVHHWFDPWNSKWYAGFSQTTYPPLPQQWVALVSHALGSGHGLHGGAIRRHIASGGRRLPVFAAVGEPARRVDCGAGERVSRLGELLVYSAGQLGTTSAAPIYLNACLFCSSGSGTAIGGHFSKASVLFTAAAAAHHATLLFGSIFFAVPVLALALLDRQDGERVSTPAFVVAQWPSIVVVGAAIAVVLLPFWIALIHYPVTQTPIPHPSRANYILSPQWGLNYFIVPYGALILALPFIFMRGSMVAGFARCCLASGWHFCWDSVEQLRWAICCWAARSKC